MGKEIVLFSSEERRDLKSVADFLRGLADKLESGQVTFKQGQQELTVDVPGSVVLEIKVEEEAKKRRTQRSLEVEIEWYEGDEGGGALTLG